METTQLEVVECVQKRDRVGRHITSNKRKEELLADYERGGLTQAGFARAHGIAYPTFATWVQNHRRSKLRQAPEPTPRFAQVQLTEAHARKTAPAILRARFSDGLELSSTDAVSLAVLIKELRG